MHWLFATNVSLVIDSLWNRPEFHPMDRRSTETTTNYAGGGSGGGPPPSLSPSARPLPLVSNDVVAIGSCTRALADGRRDRARFRCHRLRPISKKAEHTLPALTTVAVNARNPGSPPAQLPPRQIASGNFMEPEAVLCPDKPDHPISLRHGEIHSRGKRTMNGSVPVLGGASTIASDDMTRRLPGEKRRRCRR